MAYNHNDKKQCNKPCPEKCGKYDEWCESDSDCGDVHCYKKSYTITEYVCDQKRCESKRWGHKERQDCPWQPVEGCGKFHKKEHKKPCNRQEQRRH
jgi:hypothetical protein